jgi:hypothetical protein
MKNKIREIMEKQTVKVNFGNSGVNTLNRLGILFFVLGIVAGFVTISGFIIYLCELDSWDKNDAIAGLALASYFLPITINLLIAGAICKGLSNISKTELYKRATLMQQYKFEETSLFFRHYDEMIKREESEEQKNKPRKKRKQTYENIQK